MFGREFKQDIEYDGVNPLLFKHLDSYLLRRVLSVRKGMS